MTLRGDRAVSELAALNTESAPPPRTGSSPGFLAARPGRAVAIEYARLAVPPVRSLVLPATHRDRVEAFELMRSRPDKSWSFVECASILACQRRSISRVFTHDRHFTQAGLRILL